MNSGLTKEQIIQIQQVFSLYPTIKKIWLFGSRARGDFRNNSDIDIAFESAAFSFDDELGLRSKLSALPLPYSIDLVHLNSLEEEGLKTKIEQERVGLGV